jgi:hypothetical protein
MDTIKRSLWLTFLLLSTALPFSYGLQTPSEETIMVGHISHIEGELLRYVPDEDDWVATVEDAPCGIDDVLSTGEHSKAELIMPNNTWIRTGGNTQIHIIRLEGDETAVDIDSGIARLYNKSATATITATTPLGSISAPPFSVCDLYLEDDSIQVSTVEGTVDFVHVTDNARHQLTAGSSSLRAGYNEVISREEIVNDTWHTWNRERDDLWEERFAKQDDSPDYLPEELHYESYALEENGIWESVYYEGRNRSFWRPLYVSSSWCPFTVGRWTTWYGDHCWIPYEPFGYITHHYGNWVHIESCDRWYWAPPRCHRGIHGGSYLDIGFGWYPGRVSWIHRGGYVGWIPLAPFERYYCRNYWGPRSHVVHAGGLGIVAFDTEHCRYNKHAIVVSKHNFYNVTDYNTIRIRGLKDTIINHYQRAALINSRVLKRFKQMPERYTFGNSRVKQKPRLTVTERIRRNKSGERPLIEKNSDTSTRRRPRITPPQNFTPPSRKAPRVSRKTFAATKSTRHKTVRTSKNTTRKPGLHLQKRQTRTVPKPKKSTRINRRQTILKPQTLPHRKKKSRSLAQPSVQRKTSRNFSGLKQQRSSRRPSVKTQRVKARPRLRGHRL